MNIPIAGEAFGARVRELRTLAGLSQEALALAADINKETVYRIERGLDTRATTIGKLRQVLPGLDNPARVEVPAVIRGENVMVLELDAMVTRIKHLVSAFQTQDRLHRVRQYLLQQLTEEQLETQSPGFRADMHRRQELAEQQLVTRGSKRSRKTTNGSGKRRGGGNSSPQH